MSDSDDAMPEDDLPRDAHVLAGEYVLGVLDAADAALLRREAMVDLDLADAIVRWEVRLAPLAPATGIAPPPELWPRIAASIAPLARSESVGLRPRQSGWHRPGPWRAATVAALALAAAFAAVAFVPRQPLPPQIAVLLPTNAAAPAFVAQARGDGSVILTAFQPAAVPTSRDLQLWLVAPGSTRPVSLGLLPPSGRTVVLPGPQPNGAQLLVSLEPEGGSPTGLPTGPVLYGGTLRPS